MPDIEVLILQPVSSLCGSQTHRIPESDSENRTAYWWSLWDSIKNFGQEFDSHCLREWCRVQNWIAFTQARKVCSAVRYSLTKISISDYFWDAISKSRSFRLWGLADWWPVMEAFLCVFCRKMPVLLSRGKGFIGFTRRHKYFILKLLVEFACFL